MSVSATRHKCKASTPRVSCSSDIREQVPANKTTRNGPNEEKHGLLCRCFSLIDWHIRNLELFGSPDWNYRMWNMEIDVRWNNRSKKVHIQRMIHYSIFSVFLFLKILLRFSRMYIYIYIYKDLHWYHCLYVNKILLCVRNQYQLFKLLEYIYIYIYIHKFRRI